MAGLILDPTHGEKEPLYRRLKDALEVRILEDGFPDGRLPSSRALAEDLGISRNTVVLAYQELMDIGLVSSLPRSGLVVNADMQNTLRQDVETDERQPRSPDGVDWGQALDHPVDEFPHIVKPQDWHLYPYPFIYGQPSIETFPYRSWLRSLRTALEHPHLRHSLQDSGASDDEWLAELLCSKILPGRGIDATPDQVLLTAGSQHGLYLNSLALVRDGMPCGVENPGYPDASHILSRAGAEVTTLDVDADGLVVDSQMDDLKLLFVTPSHHFPTGATLSARRRQMLLDRAGEQEMFVIEDDYESEFRFTGAPSPALAGKDTSGRVIYLGSFSKFLAPGIRVGYVVGDPRLIDNLRERRRYMIRHVPGHLQRALALMISSGDYQRAIRRTRLVLKRRWTVLTEALEQHLPRAGTMPTGGTGVWIECDRSVDTRALASEAKNLGILIEPGDLFSLVEGSHTHCFRLGFGAIPESRIENGIRLLAGLIND